MSTASQEKETYWRGTVRVVAVLFLLLTSADLAFPQFCPGDNRQWFAQGESDQPKPHPAAAEDCFCCCSHLVSSSFASSLGALAILSSPDESAPAAVPAATLQLLFRPPRLA